jgi:hypothetical protein
LLRFHARLQREVSARGSFHLSLPTELLGHVSVVINAGVIKEWLINCLPVIAGCLILPGVLRFHF